MKTLAEYQAERWKAHYLNCKPIGLDIACPVCGAELEDPEPHVVLTTNPPQRHTRCSAGCGYRGYALR